MNDGKLREEMERGSRAAALLRDPLLVETFDRLRNEYIDAWRSTAPDAAAERENLFLQLRALESVKQQLESVATTGDLARRELNRGN